MALGWPDLQRMKQVEARATALGFELTKAKGDIWGSEFIEICVRPQGDAMPLYSRDAVLYSGTIESIGTWLAGLEWAREYDRMLKISSDQKRFSKEQQVRNQQLLETIQTGQLSQGTIG